METHAQDTQDGSAEVVGSAPAGKSPDLRDEDLAFLLTYRSFRSADKEGSAAAYLTALREHVLDLWRSCLAEASVHYRCVRDLMFLHARINRHPHYKDVLTTLKSDPQARYLDLGCCFGTDTRRAIVDGWPEDQIVAVDVIPHFWNYGLKLYEDEDVLKCKFLIGDVTSDQAFVNTLAASGRFAHVWTGAVLHVLDEAKVEALIRSVYALLKPGGIYFGTCVGSVDEPREWQPEYRSRRPAFLHSASSLKNLLLAIGFDGVEVWEVPSNRFRAKPQGVETEPGPPKQILVFLARRPTQ